MSRVLASLALSLVFASASAQAQTVVDYPDSTIGAAAGQYPVYTGTGTNVIRGQSFCPSSFAGLPSTAMICTKIGLQLAELNATPVQYAQFVLRAGRSAQQTLSNTWNTNLPDQRVQLDLSGQFVPGGAGVNQWFEFELANPFYWQPGDSVVIDLTTQAAVGGQYLRTAIGTGVARMVSTNYLGATTGSPSTAGGIKFRMVFEPLGLTRFGTGCPGSGGFVPYIASNGPAAVGNASFAVTLRAAPGGTFAAFTFGNPTQLPLGGGCTLYNDAVLVLSTATTGSLPGTGTAQVSLPIPADPLLVDAVLDVQWVCLDGASGSPLGLTTSAGGKLRIH